MLSVRGRAGLPLPSRPRGADATTRRTGVRIFRYAVDGTSPTTLPERAPTGGEHMPRRLGSVRLSDRPQRWSSDALLPALWRDDADSRMFRRRTAEVSLGNSLHACRRIK